MAISADLAWPWTRDLFVEAENPCPTRAPTELPSAV
jgi:hypothetical protein